MQSAQFKKTQAILEAAFESHHSLVERERDPVTFVHRYQKKRDQEVVGLFAALLAYGNVNTILSSVERALKPMGKRPAEFLREAPLLEVWAGFKHRFTTGDDLLVLGSWLKQVLNQHDSLEDFFLHGQEARFDTMRPLLSSFVQRLKQQPLEPRIAKIAAVRNRQLKYLISDPFQGSACKRLNLFLRWMVRPEDGIDIGVWKKVSPSILMLPIDTHLLQTLQKLRWTSSKTANWKVVEEATEKLRLFSSEDPIRYDFSLCHLSMRGGKLK